MKLRNLTNSTRELNIISLTQTGRREYSIYVKGNKEIDIDYDMKVINLDHLLDSGIFEIVGQKREEPVVTGEAPVEVEKLPEESVLETPVEEEVTEEVDPPEAEPVIEESQIKCPICDREFGSARGLSRHMSSVHPEQV